MGYYTNHELEVIEGIDYDLNWQERLEEISGYRIINSEAIKWYEHNRDMLQLSAEFPTMVFKLSGEGDDSEDIWVKYYKNGKTHGGKATIVFEEYDEAKLK